MVQWLKTPWNTGETLRTKHHIAPANYSLNRKGPGLGLPVNHHGAKNRSKEESDSLDLKLEIQLDRARRKNKITLAKV
jgi:hypothetical protein